MPDGIFAGGLRGQEIVASAATLNGPVDFFGYKKLGFLTFTGGRLWRCGVMGVQVTLMMLVRYVVKVLVHVSGFP